MRPVFLLVLAGLALAESTQAALMRCPSPHGDGLVITNVLKESDAQDRGCEPLQARRSALDGPASAAREPARQSVSPPPTSARSAFAESWTAPQRRSGGKPSAADASRDSDPRLVRELRDMTAAAQSSPPAADDATSRRVPTAVQRQRDSDRRSTLERELATESEAFQRARTQSLALAAGSAARTAADATVHRHAANLDALQREIARLR